MKNITELRIGNYINIHGGGDDTFYKPNQPRYLAVVTALDRTGFINWNILDKMPVYLHKSSEPILITVDWLLKLGFSKDPEINYRWYYKDNSLAYDVDDNRIRISDSWEWNKVLHVHQMQNLIYALTGKELIIIT